MSPGVGDHNPAAEFWQRKYMEERVHSTNVIDSLALEVHALREELRSRNGAAKISKIGTALSDALRDAAKTGRADASMEVSSAAVTGMAPDEPEPTGYPTP